MTSPATRAQVPTRLPEMTEKHLRAVEWLMQNRVAAGAVHIDPATLRSLWQFVRSLSTGGSHGLYEKRSERVLSLKELEEIKKLAMAGFSTGREGGRALYALVGKIDRWLSSDTQHEVADR